MYVFVQLFCPTALYFTLFLYVVHILCILLDFFSIAIFILLSTSFWLPAASGQVDFHTVGSIKFELILMYLSRPKFSF